MENLREVSVLSDRGMQRLMEKSINLKLKFEIMSDPNFLRSQNFQNNLGPIDFEKEQEGSLSNKQS